jgi:hypothetical protein
LEKRAIGTLASIVFLKTQLGSVRASYQHL